MIKLNQIEVKPTATARVCEAMTLTKRINAQIKELSAIEGGKVNMDAPMFRAALKAIARLGANQAIEQWSKPNGTIAILDLIEVMTQAEINNSIKPKRPKRKSKAGRK